MNMACPVCEGPMWDNRTSKRNPKQPDYKCKDKECDGAIWLDKKKPQGQSAAARPSNGSDNDNRSHRIERQHSQEMALRYFDLSQKIPTTAELRGMTDWFQRDVGNLPTQPKAPATAPASEEEEVDF